MSNVSEPNWITPREAADRLRLSEKTVRRWIAEGRLSAVRVGPRMLRIDVASIDATAQPLTPIVGE